MANKGRANLIPGSHKLTDADREKARESRRINSSLRRTARKIRGLAWSDDEADKLFDAFAIPEQERTVGTLIVLRAAFGAMEGNQGDRRDYIRLSGDDPDVAVKEEEIQLKKSQLDQAKEAPEDTAVSAWSEVLGQIRGVMENDESESAG